MLMFVRGILGSLAEGDAASQELEQRRTKVKWDVVLRPGGGFGPNGSGLLWW